MRKFVVWGAAAVAVGLLYLISTVFLMYDANAELHQEIAEWEATMTKEIANLNSTLNLVRAEHNELRATIVKLTKVDNDVPSFFDNSSLLTQQSSMMCVAPYGTSFFPLLPYFYREQDKVMFREVPIVANNYPIIGSTFSGSWGDIDGGKLPTLLLNNYNNATELFTYNNSFFQRNTSFPGPIRASCWGDFNRDGWEDVLVVGNGVDKLYINLNGTFTLENVPQFTSEYGEGTFCQFLDITRDSHLDIIRMNASNHLTIFRRIPKKGWEDFTSSVALPPKVKKFIGLTFFEREPTIVVVNLDGALEFYDGNSLPLKNTTAKFKGIPWIPNLVDVVIHDMNGDRLFDMVLLAEQWAPVLLLSEGEFHFGSIDLPALTEMYGYTDAFNVEMIVADFNNDMYPDVFVVRRTMYANAPNLLYMNSGVSFDIMFNGGGAAGTALGRGQSVSIADYNFDGFMDMVIFNGGGDFPLNVGPTQLYLNTPNGNNWLEIELIGTGDITDGLGAVVGVSAGNLIQVQLIHSRNKHRRLHFGIGNNTVVEKVLIFWPLHHATQVYYGMAPNQLITILDFVAPLQNSRSLDLLTERGAHKMMCEPGTERIKPLFFILGIWKAGTTSLSATLYFHPQIIPGAAKEYYYYTKYHETMSIDWYWSLFPCGNISRDVSFDGTAGYMFDKDVPALLHAHHPNAKFIIMLRDPIARAYSHFYMTTRANNDEGPQMFEEMMKAHVEKFRACTAKEGEGECAAKGSWLFLNAGIYYYAVQRWFKYFSPQQFIFVQFKDLVGPDGDKFVRDIQAFLGLEVYDLPTRTQNMSPKRAPMLNSTHTLLLEFYRPYNKLLYELLDTDFKWET